MLTTIEAEIDVVGTSIDSISNQEMFFGRADLIDQIRRSLRLKID